MSSPERTATGGKKFVPSLLAGILGLAFLGFALEAGRTPYVLPDTHEAPAAADMMIASLGIPSGRAPSDAHSFAHAERETVASPTGDASAEGPDAQGALAWSEASKLAAVEARKIHEKNAPFIGHHLSGGWTSPITADNVLSRFRVDPSEVETDATWIADEVRAETSELRAEITWLTDQYFSIREAAIEKVLAREPARKSREPIPASEPVRGGLQKISVDPSATGGWYVRYELRTAEHPELFQLEQEILPLVAQCNRRARRVVELHQYAASKNRSGH